MSQDFKFNQPANGSFTNAEGFHDWHNQYRERLLNSMTAIVRNRELAEDVTAAALGKALEQITRFRGESSLYTWVHAIALNQARQLLRRDRTVSLESIDRDGLKELGQPYGQADALEREDCCLRLRGALRELPALHRHLLTDRFFRGHSVKRIARKYQVPVGTVLSRLFTAKRLLRKAWDSSRGSLSR